ncbi:cytidine deaminase [bacterium]|nr:cytidine deaminase [bacterium]
MEETQLTSADYELIDAAKETAERLYLKDKHEVAAALRTSDGNVFSGIHIEANVGFADVCGEVSAICTALSNGHRDIDTIITLWRSPEGEFKLLPPCGRCRELTSDFNMNCWVIVGSLEEPYKVRVSELLPLKVQ